MSSRGSRRATCRPGRASLRRLRLRRLSARHDREEADDADRDEGGFDDAGGDVAEGEGLVLPFEDREQHDGAADVGDDEQDLEKRAQGHAGVGARADDVVGVVQYRGVEKERGWIEVRKVITKSAPRSARSFWSSSSGFFSLVGRRGVAS